MTRPRSGARGPHRPSRPRSLSIPGLLLPSFAVLALVLGACGSAATSDPPADPSSAGSGSQATTASDDPAASGLETPDAEPSETPAAEPTETPTDPGGSASLAIEPAADCTGTAENRTFYSSVAAAVDWTVYCPVLPSGWFVEQGSYRLAGGGRLVITYRGPAGAHFTLSEGVWCTDGSGCVPAGAEAGTTAFGDREGTLIDAGGGAISIMVDAGAPVSWLLAGDGLDDGAVRMFGAALIAVGG